MTDAWTRKGEEGLKKETLKKGKSQRRGTR